MKRILLVILIIVLFVLADGARFGKKKKPVAKPKAAPVQLDFRGIPTLDIILEEAGCTEHKTKLAKMGFSETRLLLRMQPMDFRIMEMEWEDVQQEDKCIATLQTVVTKYYEQAKEDATLIKAQVFNKERDKLNYGKIVLSHGVQSFEFVTATFGASVPRGSHAIQMDDYPHYGCKPDSPSESDITEDYLEKGGKRRSNDGMEKLQASFDESTEEYEEAKREAEIYELYDIMGKEKIQTAGEKAMIASERIKGSKLDLSSRIFVVRRGDCSYLEKALYAVERNATALVIVNQGDRVDAPASGFGIDKRVTMKQLEIVKGLPVVSISNTSWSKLSFAAYDPYQDQTSVKLQFIPLKCGGKVGIGGEAQGSGITSATTCEAVEEAEKLVQWEVSSGHMKVFSPRSTDANAKSFQFLTSNFGGNLPATTKRLQLVQSIPANACEELIFSGLDGAPKPVALVIERGGCPFHVKMLHAERAGARLAVIINMIDDPLQRIGGMLPHAGQIGIPAVLLTAPAGKHLIDSLTAANVDSEDEVEVTAEITIAQDNAGAEEWIDMAFYNWHEASSGKLLQLQSLMLKHVGNPEIVHWLQRQCDEINAAAVAAKAEL